MHRQNHLLGPWLARTGTALAVATLCACGGSDRTTTLEPPTDPSSTTSAATAPTTQREPVLTLADLPAGWTEVPAEDLSEGGDSCLDRLSAPGAPFDADAVESVTFAGGPIGPYLAALVVEQPAERVLPAVDEVLVGCDRQTNAEGITTTLEAAPLDGVPPETLAVRGRDEDADGSGVRYRIAATGTDAATVLVFAVTPVGEVDAALVAGAVEAAHSRLPRS